VCACVCVCVCVYVERDIKKREVLGLLSDPITCYGLGIRVCLISLLLSSDLPAPCGLGLGFRVWGIGFRV